MKRILFVDDEPLLLSGLRALLRRRKTEWQMDFVTSPFEALRRIAESPFDLVVSDLHMPGMDGGALLAQVRDEHPDTLRILLSGYADPVAGLREHTAAQRILCKPCDADELEDALERALNRVVATDAHGAADAGGH